MICPVTGIEMVLWFNYLFFTPILFENETAMNILIISVVVFSKNRYLIKITTSQVLEAMELINNRTLKLQNYKLLLKFENLLR